MTCGNPSAHGFAMLASASPVPLAMLVALCLAGCGRPSRPDGSPGQTIDTADFVGAGWGSAPGYRLAWAVQAGGEVSNDPLGDMFWDVAVIPSGGFYAVGRAYSEEFVFGPGTDHEIGYTWEDGALFLARYRDDGVPSWVALVEAEYYETKSVATLTDGSALVAGRVQSTPSHPPVFGAGDPTEVVLDVSCDNCPFLARYLPDGAFDWVAHGDGYRGGATDLAVADDGTVCVAGWYEDWMVFDDGTPEGILVTTDGSKNGFAGRFAANGRVLWIRVQQGQRTGTAEVAALPDGSCAFLTLYENWVRPGAGAGIKPPLIEAKSVWSVAAVVYDPDGGLVWARDMGIDGKEVSFGTPQEYCHAMASTWDGDLVIGGCFDGSVLAGTEENPLVVEAGAGTEDDLGLYVARLAGGNGARIWTSSIPRETAPSLGNLGGIYAVKEQADGAVLVGGLFTSRVTFDEGTANEVELVAVADNPDGFLASFGPDGHFRWASRLVSGPSGFYPGAGWRGEGISSVAILGDGSIVAGGHFLAEAAFGTGPGDAVTLESFGKYDAFLLRLEPDDVPPTE